MKSKTPLASFAVPIGIGRTEGHLVKRHKSADKTDKKQTTEAFKQLNLFREEMTPLAKLMTLALFALTNPNNPEKLQEAPMADIARTMGHEPAAGGQIPGHVYEQIEEVGIRLRRKACPFLYREEGEKIQVKIKLPDGTEVLRTKRKNIFRLLEISPLQTFGFAYEDEEGNPIDLDEYAEEDLVKYESAADEGPAIYAIPLIDDKGNLVLKDDGTPRRKRANGVNWRWNTDFVQWSKDKKNFWIVYQKLLPILKKHLTKPAAFNLIFLTIFWEGSHIEMGHEALIDHLGIKGTANPKQVNASIDAAFQAAYDEGIIDPRENRRDPGYYKPSQKTGRPRRKGTIYQWNKAAEWRGGNKLPAGQGEDEAKSLTDKGLPDDPQS